jgi:16S rRNA (cytosine967-C5)-methyltransferase
MARLSPARRVALTVLSEAERTGRYARELLPHAAESAALDPRDAAFALRLALGATATAGCLDDALAPHIAKPKALESSVRMALRISAFESLYLNTAPEVVVSQGVELVRSVSRGAAGLANAVLRRVCENRLTFLSAEDVAESHRETVARARRAGLPVWLVRRIVDSLGEAGVQDVLDAQLEPAPISVHVNPLRTDAVAEALGEDGATALGLPGAMRVDRVGALVRAGAFDRGDLVASDYYAQLIAAVATREGTCLEIGAGRGTKTFMMMAHAKRRDLDHDHLALDLYEGKCQANSLRVDRSGLGEIRFVAGDATDLDACLAVLDKEYRHAARFDTVFVDAPCSGTGTMRRHDEIPWRLTPQECDRDLPKLQLAMLRAAADRVAPHGELIYATCSVLRAENIGVVTAFLASPEGEGFVPVSVPDALRDAGSAYAAAAHDLAVCENADGLFQSHPTRDGFDGHFCARFVRK